MDKYRPCPSIIAMFTSDSQHPPRSRYAVYLGGPVIIAFSEKTIINYNFPIFHGDIHSNISRGSNFSQGERVQLHIPI